MAYESSNWAFTSETRPINANTNPTSRLAWINWTLIIEPPNRLVKESLFLK